MVQLATCLSHSAVNQAQAFTAASSAGGVIGTGSCLTHPADGRVTVIVSSATAQTTTLTMTAAGLNVTSSVQLCWSGSSIVKSIAVISGPTTLAMDAGGMALFLAGVDARLPGA